MKYQKKAFVNFLIIIIMITVVLILFPYLIQIATPGLNGIIAGGDPVSVLLAYLFPVLLIGIIIYLIFFAEG